MTKTQSEKYRDTIISIYGSWDEYKKQRYHTPKAREDLLEAQRKAGRLSKNRPFKDPKKASEAGKKRKYGEAEY